jgi:hypothetical protein
MDGRGPNKTAGGFEAKKVAILVSLLVALLVGTVPPSVASA